MFGETVIYGDQGTMITKQQVLDYAIKTDPDYISLVESIDEWLAETAFEFHRSGKIRYALTQTDYYKYYNYLKADFELGNWKVNGYRGSDGLYFVEFS